MAVYYVYRNTETGEYVTKEFASDNPLTTVRERVEPEILTDEGEIALTFEEYSERTGSTAIYPDAGTGVFTAINYTVLGLMNEAGEVGGKLKKIIRDENGILGVSNLLDLRDEIGDVLWYLDRAADEVDTALRNVGHYEDLGGLEQAAATNLAKLQARKNRGTLGGSGDKR